MILLPFYLFTFLLLFFSACTETVSDAKQEAAQPRIYPDYVGVTVPVNIAPPNRRRHSPGSIPTMSASPFP